MLTVALIIGALYFGSDVFVPLALAVLLSFALAPIATRLRRLGLGRVPSTLLVVVVALGFVLGFAWLLTSQAISLATDLPQYERNLREKIRILKADTSDGSGVIEQTTDFLRRVEAEIGRATATGGAGGAATTPAGRSPAAPVAPLPVEIHEPPETPLQALGEVLRVVASPLATVGIMLLFVIFVLLQREDLRDRFIRLFGSGDVHRTTEAMNDAGSRIGRYLLMQLCINLSFGTLIGAGLWLIGCPTRCCGA